MVNIGLKRMVPPVHQTDLKVTIPNPLDATRYTVLATTPEVRLYWFAAMIDWPVPQQTTYLDVYVTMPNVEYRFRRATPSRNTWYFPMRNIWTTPDHVLDPTDLLNYNTLLFEAEKMKIEFMRTGGAATSMTCHVMWARWI